MADTRRTRASILALFADNITGDISPQDLRDFVVTALGGYASIKTVEGSTAQTGIGTTPVKLTTWDTNGDANGLTPDQENGEITIDIDGVYFVNCNISFSGTSNVTFQLHLNVDDVERDEGLHRKISTGGDVGSAGFSSIVSLSANEVLSVYIDGDGTSDSVTPVDAQFTANQIA